MEWQPIETAPRDGTAIWAKRVYEGRVIAEGEAEWGVAHEAAPIREPLEPDPLNRQTPLQYAEEQKAQKASADTPGWRRRGRMFRFPEPTHWMPLPEPPKAGE